MRLNFRRTPQRRIARAPVIRPLAFRPPRSVRCQAIAPRDRRLWADLARWRKLLTWGEGVQTIAPPPDPYAFFGPSTWLPISDYRITGTSGATFSGRWA